MREKPGRKTAAARLADDTPQMDQHLPASVRPVSLLMVRSVGGPTGPRRATLAQSINEVVIGPCEAVHTRVGWLSRQGDDSELGGCNGI